MSHTSKPATTTGPDMGHWPSPLSATLVSAGGSALSFLRRSPHGLFFLMTCPDEDNIQALMFLPWPAQLPESSRPVPAQPLRVSPPGVNVRSRVHEYGGLPYAFSEDSVFYCSFQQQQLLTQRFDQSNGQTGELRTLIPPQPDASQRFVDLLYDERRQRLIAVRELHSAGAVHNSLVSICLKQRQDAVEIITLFEDSDFVASPALSAEGDLLSFISWDHPHMPWDHTRLQLAELDAAGLPQRVRKLGQQGEGSLLQPRFGPHGDLYFLADWSDWWNLYRLPAAALVGEDAMLDQQHSCAVAPVNADCCGPMWQPGAANYAFPDPHTVLITQVHNGQWSLHRQALAGHALIEIDAADRALPRASLSTALQAMGALDSLQTDAVIAYPQDDLPAILPIPPPTSHTGLNADTSVHALYRPRPLPDAAFAGISKPKQLSFSTSAGSAYGIYYPPCNRMHSVAANEQPPLLVMVHGGPSSAARSAYNLAVQFWTQRGFAVFDVDHRGSTGYGRRFRRSLYGHWGEYEIEDVIAGARHLIAAGLASPGRLAIRGGSAGGFTVLATLAASQLFSAGTSYYGISDLALLASDTHKFESHYLEQLIGPWPQARELYEQRSPLHRLQHIRAPVLMFQGMLDKVVPPNQAEAVFERLKQNNPESELICFADEAHGFRRPANQIAALERELAFYRSVLL